MLTIDSLVFSGGRAPELKRSRLASHPLMAGCSSAAVRRVASVADQVTFLPGDVLAEQGRSPEWFFLIHSGQAEVVRDDACLGVLGPGDYFGEVPLLGRGMQPATVRARTPMVAFVIGSQRFVPLVQDLRSLRSHMDAALARQGDLLALARAERTRHLHPRPRGTAWRAPPPAMQLRRRLVLHRPPPRTRPVLAAVAAVLVSAALAASMYHPPLAVVSPGPVIDVSHDIAIGGVPVHPARGRYLLVTVRLRRPSLLGIAMTRLHGDRPVVSVARSTEPAAARTRRQAADQFTRSQGDAAAAAARALGMPVTAAGDAPFSVRFRHRAVVGPSGGLVYALAIADMLSAGDRAHGRTIAATGEVDRLGDVRAVGYVGEKADGGRAAGADLLLVPEAEADDALQRGMSAEGVRSLAEALSILART
jgi:PDZ domain-containing protein